MADLIDRAALLKDMGLTDAVKYGNKTAEQQYRSYSTWMSYEIADAIQDAPAVNCWIPCSEKFPEDGQRVLICSKSERFFDVIFRANAKMPSFCAKIFGKVYAWYCEDIIKWMPLPEQPKEGDKDA